MTERLPRAGGPPTRGSTTGIPALARLAVCGLSLAALPDSASSQAYKSAPSAIPQGSPDNNSFSENVDFGDADQDGDWDAIFADGGDLADDVNRIWINNGGSQGGTVGTFTDETGARCPSVLSQSRDIEFVDFDGDSDLDVYSSNTSENISQTNRWWVNEGNQQGGAVGFYADETSSRWVGLGGPGSSIAHSALLGGGGFKDWSCDGDFADLDNDGDMDLFHSSYGNAFSGDIPSRVFLNDGNGFFSEFNPSGFKLSGDAIFDGEPALWAEGLHVHNTTSTDGASADIAGTPLDIDLGDIDGDFDLDILHGNRSWFPRLFVNRLEETGTMSFRDRSWAQFPILWASPGWNYEQELGDLDGDGDLDIMGLNWEGFNDVTMRNDGAGTFTEKSSLPGSGSDDNEIDAVDYDNDGDLDIYVANWSGQDKLYRNDDGGSGAFDFTKLTSDQAGLSDTTSTSLDADMADVDKDGDYDVMTAATGGAANVFLRNITQTPDTHAPYIPRSENPGDLIAGTNPVPVRAQVYDNAPYYVTWYNQTDVLLHVESCLIDTLSAVTSGGNIFRAELPGNLVGAVSTTWLSRDEYGNSGLSSAEFWTSSYGGQPSDDSFTSPFGPGTAGSLGVPTIELASVPFGSGSDAYFVGAGMPASTPFFFFLSAGSIPPLDLSGIATVNVDPDQLVLEHTGTTTLNGCAVVRIPVTGGSGIKAYAQLFCLDGVGGDLVSGTRGLEVSTQ